MRPFLRTAGIIIWWCGWPVMWLYLRNSKRTRLVLRNEQGQVLLVKGWIASGNKWSLPGGGLHRGEEPLPGVLREVQEEIGIHMQAHEVSHVCDYQIKSKGFQFYLYFFAATIAGDPALHLQGIEIADAQWIDTSGLTIKNAEPDVLKALTFLAPND